VFFWISFLGPFLLISIINQTNCVSIESAKNALFVKANNNLQLSDQRSEKALWIMMRYRDISMKTIDKWGEEAQYDQMIEECAELIATLQHFARGKVEENVVVDELADVFLKGGKLTYMFGEDKLQQAVENKITKLKCLLDQ